MFIYNIPRNEWKLLKAPSGAPPRSGHQMVAVAINKGQLWVFGGEYASPTQSQFYHYKDLWVYHMANKRWEKIKLVFVHLMCLVHFPFKIVTDCSNF